jgi:hypothetical protein
MVTGGGTGAMVTGGGTGAMVTGGGTGSTILVTGGGTGSEAVAITLPDGTGMVMEVSVQCGLATVTVLDSNFAPVVSFDEVPVIGEAGFCQGDGFGSDFRSAPGADFYD